MSKFLVLILLIDVLAFGAADNLKLTKPVIALSTTKVDIVNESLYREGQKEFRRKNYEEAIKLFEAFVKDNKNRESKYTKSRVFWSIDMVVRSHLKIKKDPEAAIKFLNKVNKNVNFNDAESDIISEWLSVAKEWQKLGSLPHNIKNKEELYRLGGLYYNKALKKMKYPADEAGKLDLHISATYLIPYVFNFDNSKNIGNALFMLGKIRNRSWNDYEYWAENFYLKEVIRRYPHSELARKAYDSLEEGVRFGYTGSAGDFTPPSQIKMLKVYKRLSQPNKIKLPLIY